MLEQVRSIVIRGYQSYVLVVVAGLLVGGILVGVMWSAGGEPGTVAVVPVEGTLDGDTANEYTAMMIQARENPAIDAVVLVVNSGGGSSAASEEMYLQTKRTAEQLPVVASADAGALSGAYFTISPADTIVVKPATTVGSIGVLVSLPRQVEPNNVIATTGPDKLTGGDQREIQYLLDSIHRAFLNAVLTQRGDRLALSRAELSEGRIYSGGQAVRVGLADAMGGEQAAIDAAARQAGLSEYRVRVLEPESSEFVSRNNYLASDTQNKQLVPPRALLSAGSEPVFLSIPYSYVSGGLTPGNDNVVPASDPLTEGESENVSRMEAGD